MEYRRVKLTTERLPNSTVRLDIAADPDEFAHAYERAFRRISQRVAIPGFRPGRAPRQLVERRIGREYIVAEAQRELMDRLYRQAIEQESLMPVAEPSVEIYQEEPLAFRVEVQVYPTVELGDYHAIRVEPRTVEVTDADVDAVLENLRLQQAVWKEPAEPRTPREGDQVIVDLQAFEGDEPFQSPLEGAAFVLGESNLFPQIEEALKSLRPGETAEFDISFAEDDERVSPELRGKTLHYRVTLREIKERELPELDDSFAASVGDFDSLAALRARIRDDLLRQRALAAREAVVAEAIDKLIEQATIDLPPALIDREVEHELEHLRQRLREQNSSLEEYLRLREQTLDDLRAELRPQAERRLRQFLALDAFAKAEGLAVTEDDLAAEIERLSAGSENPEQARAIYQSPYFRDFLLDELQSRKVTEQLLAIVTEGRGPVVGEAARFLEPAEAAAEPAAEEAADSEAAAIAEDAAESAATAEDAAADMAATDQQPLDEQAEPVPVAASEPAAEPEAASDAPAHDQSHEEGV